jgi:hypothetical protein
MRFPHAMAEFHGSVAGRQSFSLVMAEGDPIALCVALYCERAEAITGAS